LYLGKSENSPIPEITAPNLRQDFSRRPAGTDHYVRDFHLLGVEGGTERVNRFQAMLGQGAFDALQTHGVSRAE
jgi:hypothetical protein